MEDLFRYRRCLIVDDFEQMRVCLRQMLTQFGVVEIETAPSGEQALRLLSRSPFDMVICDYNLGDGKDGQQVLEEARYLGYLGHASTFFMVTAESHLPMVLGALEHQPDEYMIKPINSDVFQHRLLCTLQRKKRLSPIDEALAKGEKQQAIQYCAEQSGGDLKHGQYLSKLRAELCIDIGSYDEAEKIYLELLKIRDFPWAHFGLGKIDFLKKRLDQAEDRFWDLIKKNKHFLEVYDWQASVQEEKGQAEQAQQLLQQAVKLAPQSVARQRRLGLLALNNGDLGVAERAFQAAVRWGKSSCFAEVQEYLELAEIYKQMGRRSKQIQLLADGVARFDGRPIDQIKVLGKQAIAKQEQNKNSDISLSLRKLELLAANHSDEISAEILLTLTEDCYRLARQDSARSLLRTLIGNYHDESRLLERVRQLVMKYDESTKVDKMIKDATSELLAVQAECARLLDAGKMIQAISQLIEAVERYPANRSLILATVQAMISYMLRNGRDQAYYFRCRQALERLLRLDSDDKEAVIAFEQLSKISSAKA